MGRPSPEEVYRVYTEVYETGIPPAVYNYPFDLRDRFREYSSVGTPQWPRLKRNNPYHLFRSEHMSRPLLHQRRLGLIDPNNWDDVKYYYRTPTFTAPAGINGTPGDVYHLSGPRDLVVQKCIDKIKDQKVNFAQMLAERKQVERMFVDTVDRLSRAVRAAKRGNLNGVRAALGYSGGPRVSSGAVAKDWLAFQYGWKPLLSDVHGAAEELAKSNYGRPLLVAGRHKASISDQRRIASNQNSLAATVIWTQERFETKARGELRFYITNELTRLGSVTGITDPLLLAWELLPWSFVADWFIPVGNFLQNLNYDSGLTFDRGYVTQFSERECSVTVPAQRYTFSNLDVTQDAGVAVTSKGLLVDREALYTPPAVLWPTWKDPFSPTHFWNALSLLRGRFHRAF